MQNAKCKIKELRCKFYNLIKLDHCRGRSLCLPVINRKPCGRALRPDPTIQPVWCVENIPTISDLHNDFGRDKKRGQRPRLVTNLIVGDMGLLYTQIQQYILPFVFYRYRQKTDIHNRTLHP